MKANQNESFLLLSALFTQEYVKGYVIIVILQDFRGGKTLYKQFLSDLVVNQVYRS